MKDWRDNLVSGKLYEFKHMGSKLNGTRCLWKDPKIDDVFALIQKGELVLFLETVMRNESTKLAKVIYRDFVGWILLFWDDELLLRTEQT